MAFNVTITTGIPASGKSTYAKDYKNTHVELNLDLIREELSGDASNQAVTLAAIEVRNKRLEELINQKRNIIISDTNAHPEFRVQLIQQILDLGVPKEDLGIANFPINPTEAKVRNAKRVNPVPPEVIDRMYTALVEHPPQQDAERFEIGFMSIVCTESLSLESEWGNATTNRIKQELEDNLQEAFRPSPL